MAHSAYGMTWQSKRGNGTAGPLASDTGPIYPWLHPASLGSAPHSTARSPVHSTPQKTKRQRPGCGHLYRGLSSAGIRPSHLQGLG